MNRTAHSQARQRGALIRDALAAVNALPEPRLAQLGAASGLSPADARADLQRMAEERPRCVLTAFSREVCAASALNHSTAQGTER